MSTSKFKLDTNAPTVSWADPKNAESSASSQVSIYIYFCYGFLSHFFCFYLFIVLGMQRHSLHPVLCPLSAQNYITILYYPSDLLDVVLLDAFVRRSSHIGA